MLKSLISLFLESNCPLCDRTARNLICQSCCDRIHKEKNLHSQTSLKVFAWGAYRGQLKRAIAALKYQNCPELGQLMGLWLGEAWLKSSGYKPAKKIIVVPIPMHSNKLKQRGYNQAELIARGFCQFTGFSLRSRGLKRIKETKAMFALTSAQRKENIRSAFGIGPEFAQKNPRSPVLLIDDIYTTGNTVTEATKILEDRGIKVFGAATLSKTASQN